MQFLGPTFNTFFQGAKRGKPDLIFSNSKAASYNTYIEGGPILASDHRVVKLHVSIAPIHIEVNPHYNYDKANWDKYKEKLEAFSVPNLQGQPHTVLTLVAKRFWKKKKYQRDGEFPFKVEDLEIPKM